MKKVSISIFRFLINFETSSQLGVYYIVMGSFSSHYYLRQHSQVRLTQVITYSYIYMKQVSRLKQFIKRTFKNIEKAVFIDPIKPVLFHFVSCSLTLVLYFSKYFQFNFSRNATSFYSFSLFLFQLPICTLSLSLQDILKANPLKNT